MRPDQHKQKKSSQYKKKHGMQSSTTDKQSDAKTHREPENQPHSPKASGQAIAGEVENPFTKRKIKSNWNKYEEEDEGLSQIGEDYDVLMSYASQSNSHLKLKSEKEWDLNEEIDDALTIDCEKIADALSQLTFCERYGFDVNDFEPSLLKILDGTIPNSTHNSENSVALPLVVDKAEFDFQAPIPMHQTPEDQISNSVNKESTVVNDGDDHADRLLKPTAADTDDILGADTLHKVDDLECDLDDLLLSTAVPDKRIAVENQTPIPCDTVQYSTEVSPEDKSGEEDLEEWLDSII